MTERQRPAEPPFSVRPKTVEQMIDACVDYLDDLKNQPVREHRRYVYVEAQAILDICNRLVALEARAARCGDA